MAAVGNASSDTIYACPEQLHRAQTLYSVSLGVSTVSTLILGYVYDKCGPRFAGVLGALLCAACNVLITVALRWPHLNDLVWLAIPLCDCAGGLVSLSMWGFTWHLPEKQATVSSLYMVRFSPQPQQAASCAHLALLPCVASGLHVFCPWHWLVRAGVDERVFLHGLRGNLARWNYRQVPRPADLRVARLQRHCHRLGHPHRLQRAVLSRVSPRSVARHRHRVKAVRLEHLSRRASSLDGVVAALRQEHAVQLLRNLDLLLARRLGLILRDVG
jgi:hypothetical protein